jgi:hypothetical protein
LVVLVANILFIPLVYWLGVGADAGRPVPEGAGGSESIGR